MSLIELKALAGQRPFVQHGAVVALQATVDLHHHRVPAAIGELPAALLTEREADVPVQFGR